MGSRLTTPGGLPRGVALALAIAFLARALLPIAVWQLHGTSEAFLARDSSEYLALAESLATTGAYAADGRSELRRLPGFPALLALADRIGDPIAVTLVLHVTLGLATTLLCYSIARHLAGERAGVAAALLFACATGLWVWGALLLSETLFVFLLAAMLWSFVRYERSDRVPHLLLAVALACACAYVRVVGYLLPFLLIGWLALGGRRHRRRVARAAGALAVAVVLLGAWHLRNGLVAGYWGFSTQLERSLYFLGGGTEETIETGASYSEARVRLEDRLRAEGATALDDPPVIAEMRSRGLRAVVAHPGSFAVSWAVGLGAVLAHSNTGTALRLFKGESIPRAAAGSGLQQLTRGRWGDAASHLRQRGAAHWLVLLLQTAQLLLYYALCARAFRRPGLPGGTGVLLLVAICLLLLSGGPHGNARYRAPLMPSICVLAGIGLARYRTSESSLADGIEPPAGGPGHRPRGNHRIQA